MRQLALDLAPPPAPLSDDPLTAAELDALSRLGWEYPRSHTTPGGCVLVTLRYEGWGATWERGDEERRTPGGWRQILRDGG